METAEQLVIVGANHRSATPTLRERLFLETQDQAGLFAELRDAGLPEACIVSTCDRVEIVAVHDEPAAVAPSLAALLARRGNLAPEAFAQQSFRLQGAEALRHLFAVTASLDSQVVGEPQILGQIKESHRTAGACGMLGPGLEAVLQAAYSAAKRVRSETNIGERPVTMAAAALWLARRVHGDLERCGALLVGLGEMSEALGQELRDAAIGSLMVVHRSSTRAADAAHRLGGHYRAWEELDAALVDADVVVAAVGSGQYTVTEPVIRQALKRRRQRPIFLVDAAVPGDIDPALEAVSGAFVYDLEDLERVAQQGVAAREAVVMTAWEIIGEEISNFLRQRAERSAVPAVTALRDHFESVRQQILSNGKLDAESATRLLVNRLLHDPSEVLRQTAGRRGREGRTMERAIKDLFRLRPEDARGRRSRRDEEMEE